MSAIHDAAMSYIEQSPQWPLFPVHSRTKRPLIKTGTDHAANASTDPEQIERWLRVFPGCGFGMPTGAASGVVVVDADRKHDGELLLAALENVLGPLPRERMVRTQSGGLHVYCAHPGGGIRVKTSAGDVGPLGRLLGGLAGVDVRADGGIVVLPPSSGYAWIRDEDDPLPPLPARWLAAIQGVGESRPKPRRPVTTGSASDVVADMLRRMQPIGDGRRNQSLFLIGVRLRHDGKTDNEILDALERVNASLVTPPLSDREIQRIAKSAARGTP